MRQSTQSFIFLKCPILKKCIEPKTSTYISYSLLVNSNWNVRAFTSSPLFIFYFIFPCVWSILFAVFISRIIEKREREKKSFFSKSWKFIGVSSLVEGWVATLKGRTKVKNIFFLHTQIILLRTMATRLATTRNNFITVTAVKNEEESDANTSMATSNTTNTINCTNADIQRAHLTPVSLHHVNLSQVIA